MASEKPPTHKLIVTGGALLLLVTVFVFAATVSFDPTDWPSAKAWPHPQPPHNACGNAGAWLAYQLFYWLGHGAYPLLLLGCFLAVRAAAGRVTNDLPLRLTGIALVSVVVATAARMIQPGSLSSLPEGNGGIIGIALATIMAEQFAALGSTIILLCGAIVGLLLAADELLLSVPLALARLVRLPLNQRPRRKVGRTKPPLLKPILTTAWRSITAVPLTLARLAKHQQTPTHQPQAETVPVNTGHSRLIAARIDTDPSSPEVIVAAPAAPPLTDQLPADSQGQIEDAQITDSTPTTTPQPPVTTIDPPGIDQTDDQLDTALPGEADQPPADLPAHDWAGAAPRVLDSYELPQPSLLDETEYVYSADHESVVREKARLLERTLHDFRVQASVVQIDTGPVVTMYELALAPGVKVSQIQSLAHDMARALKAPAIRVVAPMPGKNTIGIEVPNIDKEKVRLRELLTLSGNAPGKMGLPLFLGKDASGNPLVADLATMPHLLIAGTTGSGKSVCINALVMSLLMTQRPDHVQLILVDPKMVELSVFRDVPHLMCPIVTDIAQAELILDWATTKMDERYELLAEAGVKNIAGFNRLTPDEIIERFNPVTDDERQRIPMHLPYILIVIDELADLMMTAAKNVEHHLSRLAQKSRAVGVHIIVATQRPQANIVTGLIKSNIPCRIAFRVASRMDSRIVLDQNGAEVLMGAGDMLFLPPGSSKLVRAQGTFVRDQELRRVIDYLGQQADQQFHHELVNLRNNDAANGPRDELFDQAAQIVLETRRGSVSLLQRRLTVGYARASRLIDQMAAAGIVGVYKGSQAREVVMTLEQWEQVQKTEYAEQE